jgi:hypothetical protein
MMTEKRYNELFEMSKNSFHVKLANGEVSYKKADIKAIHNEFRLNGPMCGNSPTCHECLYFSMCWNGMTKE